MKIFVRILSHEFRQSVSAGVSAIMLRSLVFGLFSASRVNKSLPCGLKRVSEPSKRFDRSESAILERRSPCCVACS